MEHHLTHFPAWVQSEFSQGPPGQKLSSSVPLFMQLSLIYLIFTSFFVSADIAAKLGHVDVDNITANIIAIEVDPLSLCSPPPKKKPPTGKLDIKEKKIP